MNFSPSARGVARVIRDDLWTMQRWLGDTAASNDGSYVEMPSLLGGELTWLYLSELVDLDTFNACGQARRAVQRAYCQFDSGSDQMHEANLRCQKARELLAQFEPAWVASAHPALEQTAP